MLAFLLELADRAKTLGVELARSYLFLQKLWTYNAELFSDAVKSYLSFVLI